MRNGKELVLKAKADNPKAAKARDFERVPELIGASVGTLESGGKPEAVAVIEVVEGSPAYAHGLREGDVIVAVNRKKVRSSAELIAALKVPGRVVLSVVRGDYVFGLVLRK